jgi:hypothetical protein
MPHLHSFFGLRWTAILAEMAFLDAAKDEEWIDGIEINQLTYYQ